ncbi:arabinan endo-1,5-alpha-L-arabinosidase [Pseudoduganella ginsengisoli]|uniref:Extracellular exo-alpha-(1->5)-L-arabinofuranosidase n=1 Tax=Pseudoduganella ginsengisoli TaxID=1462440 RepID=A0A6L6PW93_9BURK|nr:arabinan endo-1,5-alpha-L-arabinosidase [Pseudoduganella ginsengisoli]MTW01506.1 family 43 glycosylhydrolase [Pseudoduganella ginsengisoli]
MKYIATLVAALLTTMAHAVQVDVHDPVMARDGNKYYVFSTGPGITFYSSTNMVDWKPEGRVFAGQPAWAKAVAPGFDGHIWAPDIHRHNGKYYLYYSVSAFGKNTSGIGVTVNKTLDPKSPDYKWEDQGMVLQSIPGRDQWNAIDPNVVVDDNGVAWMSFGSFWSGLKLVKLDASHTKLAQPEEWKAIAARPGATTAQGGSAGPEEIEAPFIFRKNGYYYLFASWGLCCQKEKSTYHVVVGRSRDVTGPYLDKDGKDMAKGGGSLVIAGDKDWKGLGHNSAYTFDGRDYMVLHAYETADHYLQKLKVLEMKWDKDAWPVVDQKDLNRYHSTVVRQ